MKSKTQLPFLAIKSTENIIKKMPKPIVIMITVIMIFSWSGVPTL